MFATVTTVFAIFNEDKLNIYTWKERKIYHFAKRSKILAGYKSEVILLNYQNNYVEHSNLLESIYIKIFCSITHYF